MADRISKRDLLAYAVDLSGFGRVLRAARAWNGVLILNYHRVGNAEGSPFDHNLWSASAEDFERQIAFLAKNFDMIGLSELDESLRATRGRRIMITFDDGYRDNYSTAFPILKSFGVTATFFIATGFLDSPRVPWWDEIAWMVHTGSVACLVPPDWLVEWMPSNITFSDDTREHTQARLLSIYKSLPTELTETYLDFLADSLGTRRCPTKLAEDMWMTWEMVREMQSKGMTFGGHTVSHPILANSTADQQDWEVGECRRRLETELGRSTDVFSYPNGKPSSFNEFTRAALRNHGYRRAFCHSGGYCEPSHVDQFGLCRSPVETDIDLPKFRATATLPQLFS